MSSEASSGTGGGTMEPPVPSGTSETSRTGTRIEMLERPHSVTRSSAIAMIGAIVSQCLRLVVVVYVARRFSSAQFGSFSFAMAVNAYVFVVAHFGLPLYGARAVAKAGRVSLRLVQAITCARASLSVFGLAIALGSLSLFPQVTKEELLVVTTFGLSNLALAGLYDWAFQGLGRLDISALLNTLWQGTWLILT